jgi:hypothetical protein
MEAVPTFASALSSSSITLELQAQIDEAINMLPPAHRRPPLKGEIVDSPASRYIRLQDWAFTHRFYLVIESAKGDRTQFRCIHHQKQTRNTRKTAEADRQRVETSTQARGCPFSLYISRQKRLGDRWAVGFNLEKLQHNHALNPDALMYIFHRSKRPSYSEALELASDLRGVVGYSAASQVLKKKGWEIDWKQFYNLLRKEEKGSLTRQDELVLILKILDNEGLHPQVREEYILNEDSNCEQRNSS